MFTDTLWNEKHVTVSCTVPFVFRPQRIWTADVEVDDNEIEIGADAFDRGQRSGVKKGKDLAENVIGKTQEQILATAKMTGALIEAGRFLVKQHRVPKILTKHRKYTKNRSHLQQTNLNF